jgi:ComF family protein
MAVDYFERLKSLGRELLLGARHILYPGCCLLCGQLLPASAAHFCFQCRHDLFHDPHPNCPRCAGSVGPFAVVEGRCVACRGEPFAFEQTLRVGPYDGVLREVILRLKHQRGESLAELLGEYWGEEAAERFAALRIDALTPVPLHWLRRWSRGYNQSAALCRGLATALRLPHFPWWLRRIRHTPRQHLRSPAERKANVRGAFRTRPGADVKGRSILLVDDVMTTGATVGEATKTLLAAGAERVVVAVLARAQG